MIVKKTTQKKYKGFKMRKTIHIIALIATISIVANADCFYGDQNYPEGAIRGPYICINGDWVRR